ncbi:MAG: hypothetical protein HYR84_03285 [Planctomycetes bacterium]|nr:hypothetical protein [Planctomycetota bacterium]
MELTGVVTNGHVVLDQPCPIADGTQVTVRVADPVAVKQETTPTALGKRLLKHAGTVPGLPEDLAQQHDHYIHGTPKR